VAVVAIAAPLPTAAAAPSGLGLLADVDVVATPDAIAGPRMLPPTARSVAGPVAGVAVAVGGVPLTIGVAGPSDPLVGTGLSAPVDDGWAVAVDRSSAAASFWPCRERWLVVGDVADPEALLLPSPVGAAVPVPSSPEDPVAAAPAVEGPSMPVGGVCPLDDCPVSGCPEDAGSVDVWSAAAVAPGAPVSRPDVAACRAARNPPPASSPSGGWSGASAGPTFGAAEAGTPGSAKTVTRRRRSPA
jgi:hypothetical protein